MRLKPKSTVKNPKALVYKRFTSLKRSESLAIVYQTDSDGRFWIFNNDTLLFEAVDAENVGRSEIIHVANFTTVLAYQGKYFRYADVEWQETTEPSQDGITLLSASFANIAKYQTNEYYFTGSFDYKIKGSVSGTTVQFIKGNKIPFSSMNIVYYDDSVDLAPDDLVVIDGRLFSVENPETSIKQLPRAFKVYFATLNSVL